MLVAADNQERMMLPPFNDTESPSGAGDGVDSPIVLSKTVMPSKLVVTKSGLPSLLRSPAATHVGPPLTEIVAQKPNTPLRLLVSTVRVPILKALSVEFAQLKSGQPSPLISDATTNTGALPTV